MKPRRKDRKFMIFGLCAVVLVMSVAYAAFSSLLQINGTATLGASWNVHLVNTNSNVTGTNNTGVTIGSSNTPSGTVSASNYTATITATLCQPGDTLVFPLSIVNEGSLDAVISNISATESWSDAIKYEILGIQVGDTLAVSQTRNFSVKIYYDDNISSQPSITTNTLVLNFEVTQDVGEQIDTSDILLSHSLPDTYQQVEYLASSGTQYINTNISPDNYTSLDIVYKDTSATGSNYVVGSRNASSSTINYAVSGASATLAISSTFNGSSYTLPYTRSTDNMHHIYQNVEYNQSSGYRLYTSATNLTTSATSTGYTSYSSGVAAQAAAFHVFGFNSGNIHRGMQLYQLRIWKSGSLVGEFVPCYRVSDSVAGLYNLVDGSFHTNLGSGSFTVGADV